MNIPKVIADLRQYKAQLEQAIAALDRLARKRGGRRGRPPKWMAQAGQPRTRKFSAATRMRMAAAQRRRWAQRKSKGSK